jgi:hypothetical protein
MTRDEPNKNQDGLRRYESDDVTATERKESEAAARAKNPEGVPEGDKGHDPGKAS